MSARISVRHDRSTGRGIPSRLALATLMAGACSAAWSATEYGRVISSTAVQAQMAVSQPQCRDELQPLPPQSSGAGALVGALVGGAVGNAVGAGAGRAAATALGVFSGAVIGDRAEAAGNPPGSTLVRVCQPGVRYEPRIVGYDVVYEYNGRRYSTRTEQDPGPRIALDVNVSPVGAVQAPPPAYGSPPPAYASPPVAYAAPPAYAAPVYGAPVYYGAPPAYGYYGGAYPLFVPSVGVFIGGYGYRGRWR